MKFSHTLSLNANPDWIKHYIDYASLKKVINECGHDTLSDDSTAASDRFVEQLMEMVAGVREFYFKKLAELNSELSRLKPMLERSASVLDLEAMAEETSSLLRSRKLRSLNGMNVSETELEDIRREICDSFTQYHNLQTYASLNCTAVRKILKKHDKAMGTKFIETQLDSFRAMLPFWEGTPEIDRCIDILKQYFAHFFCNDDQTEALRRLKLMVREVVEFQRRSVWLDVIQDQRKHQSATVVEKDPPNTADSDTIGSIVFHLRSNVRLQLGILSMALFIGLLVMPGLFDDNPTQRNALAMLVFVSLLWAGEVMPLFVTAMLVPFLAVVLRIPAIDGVRLDARAASQRVFAKMFSHVIMLLIGGFSIAAALSKHNVAKIAATSVAVRFGSGTRTVLLVNLMLATVASMWISNVAAPVLCYSLVAPILKAATAETSRSAFGSAQQDSAECDRRLCRALIMGIALASNVGGMASPISSPQNLFAIEYTPIGWPAWFSVSVPLCVVLDIVIWVWLIYCFDLPSIESAAVAHTLQKSRTADEEHFTPKQNFVIVVSVGVVILWCASISLETFTGQMGLLGIVPFAIFFGFNILAKEDLNNFLWSVVILAMGGLVLGDVVESSGLLDVVAEVIAGFIERKSLSLWVTMVLFTSLILVCTTFVSHTVGAIVVLPILQSVGLRMDTPGYAKVLVFAGALACSAAMGLPVSGFPNMTAVSQEDSYGKRFVTTRDFLKYAVPASVFSWIVIATFGYGLILKAVEIDRI